MRIEGQKVLITGGGSGIGRALARGLLDRGAQVAICGRRQEKLDRATEEEPRLVAINADIADTARHDAFLAEVQERLGGLTMLVNNAGTQKPFDVQDPQADWDAFRAEMETNLMAPFHLAWRAVPILKTAPQAAIVNVTSALALIPKPDAPAYDASKAGLRGATIALRLQLATTSIRVFEILPGQVQTETTWGTQSAGDYVDEVIGCLIRDRTEIMPGKTKWLWRAHRLSPDLARGLVRRMAARAKRMREKGKGKLPGG
jgi:uncharacterized oxidoreductase